MVLIMLIRPHFYNLADYLESKLNCPWLPHYNTTPVSLELYEQLVHEYALSSKRRGKRPPSIN